jgi:hypothetical protein
MASLSAFIIHTTPLDYYKSLPRPYINLVRIPLLMICKRIISILLWSNELCLVFIALII